VADSPVMITAGPCASHANRAGSKERDFLWGGRFTSPSTISQEGPKVTRVRNTFLLKRQKELARKEKRQSIIVQIQYEGLVVAQAYRGYNFLVIDPLRGSRQFTVKVPLDLFRSTSLLYQDGPSLCFEILQKKLDSETQESLVKSHLNIGEKDLREYIERRYPRKRW